MFSSGPSIRVRGAREHNLRGIDVDLPRDALVVITGVSGSGKSSLAFDTIYQEGQRRFLESLSPYARQFLGQMEKPRVDRVEGLSPTLSIDQKTVNRNPRSTVGTITEVYDHFRLLYARLGEPHCPICKRLIARRSPSDLADHILREGAEQRLQILAPMIRDRKGEYRKELEEWLAAGWLRARIDGQLVSLEDPPALARYEKHTIELVIDRIIGRQEERARLVEAVERAVAMSGGLVAVLIGEQHHLYSIERGCPDHDVSIPEMEPRLFSFNAPQGACERCLGLGFLLSADDQKVLCPRCLGRRLNPVALAVTFRGVDIDTMSRMSVGEARAFYDTLELQDSEKLIGLGILREIRSRLQFLDDVGLGYLSLDRRANTLSGGESQRIRLAACVGAALQGVTYVLDEPSIGLHARDNRRLLRALAALRDIGNTVLVVEHDRETMELADWVLDIGPGAGRLGGQLVGEGPPGRFAALNTQTARYLRGDENIAMPPARRAGNGKVLHVEDARVHNLQGLSVSIPLGTLTVLTGVSGSGKSTLLFEVIEASLNGAEVAATLHGAGHIDKVIEINQQPIGRTPRSNPATYTGAFDLIRDLFAANPEARARGYLKGRFSFNVPGGRCETCEGAGVRTIAMQFLADVEVPCEQCEGKRFLPETLEIHYKDKSIADILAMTITEAVAFFAHHKRIYRSLATLEQVGLGYVTLGQSATTLSGGEAQRLKLATELQRPPTGRTLYLLDEPTTGLHFQDVQKLIDAIQALVDAGNTVLVIEHNTDLIKVADHLIELGPEGGKGGGRLLAQGTPEALARTDTPTGLVLSSLPDFGAPLATMVNEAPLPRYVTSGMLDVRGARCHNLKGVDVQIPHGKMTVITGVSGSGKTSLAFDTIFAEGQRRYVESLSTYARRFLGRLDRPSVERVSGLAPSIAIDQRSSAHNPRSTVATVTEIHDHLRLLWANVGTPHCPKCDLPIAPLGPGQAAHVLAAAKPGKGRLVAKLANKVPASTLLSQGYSRAMVRNKEVRLEDAAANGAEVDTLVIDRFDPTEVEIPRLAESIALAYRLGHGRARFLSTSGAAHLLSSHPECAEHGRYPIWPLTPRHFSFNHYLGACNTCDGLGRTDAGVCPACKGARLKPALLAVKFGGSSIAALSQHTVEDARRFFANLQLDPTSATIAAQPLREIQTRLRFLSEVGLGYLSLDRSADTLSGGEAQRIRLASQLGSGLTGCIYVLDEPTIGLHPRDTQLLLDTLDGLRDLGNTLVVVEHDPAVIRHADHVIDLGPGAGEDGGRVLDQAPPDQLGPSSLTGQWLRGERRLVTSARRRPLGPPLKLRGATRNNLRGVDVDIPTGVLCAVTGVSGSGKSTLIMDLLVGALKGETVGATLRWTEKALELTVVDQSPIGRSPRSTPATYVGVLDPIRALYAATPMSQERGYGPGRFSFNTGDGACQMCNGHGQVQVEMHFLSNVWIRCESCGGRRYSRETLDIRWKGLSIADVLDLRVREAAEVFAAQRRILKPLQALVDVGLGYLRLGQPGTELSGGEAQRIKLACGLMARAGRHIYILDEPTTGLHLQDVDKLLTVFDRLVDQGNTVLVVEHHLDVIRHADWIIDMGPEAGAGGGKLVAVGTPEQVQTVAGSWTGRALRA